MARKKKREFVLRGGQLLARGDVIQVMDGNAPVTCKVLACLGTDDGGCLASLEIIDGERKGERIDTKLRPNDVGNDQPGPE
jgi:hypothetical protein